MDPDVEAGALQMLLTPTQYDESRSTLKKSIISCPVASSQFSDAGAGLKHPLVAVTLDCGAICVRCGKGRSIELRRTLALCT